MKRTLTGKEVDRVPCIKVFGGTNAIKPHWEAQEPGRAGKIDTILGFDDVYRGWATTPVNFQLTRRGLQEAARELKRIYRFFHAEQNVRLAIGHHEHGYHPEVQQAMVSFFCRQAGLRPPRRAPKLRVETPKTLAATPRGQVIAAGARPIYEVIAEQANHLAMRRKPLAGGCTTSSPPWTSWCMRAPGRSTCSAGDRAR